ncbi:MAG: carbohydrate ABC transporter substrate-binding protein [Clostridia bacterium]|nr:carbohydrate ABC transporter substrate-binding protein [Clostridia bacterium]
MKKIICLLLAILLVLPLAVACNNDEKPPVTTGDNTGDTTTAPDGTEPAVTSDAETSDENMLKVPTDELDFENEEVVITAFDWQGYKYYFFAEEESEDPMEAAIYNRRRSVEEAIGVAITERMYATYDEMYSAMEQSVGTGDDAMQIVLTHCISRLSTYTSGGTLFPLDELPYVNLDADWWNKEQMGSLKLGSHYLLGANDYMLPCPYAIFFNKDMITNLGIENPYDLVEKNEWTIDKYEELARAASRDADSSGTYDENDYYGISCQNGGGSTFLSFWSASEQFMAYKDDDGKLSIFENNEKAQDICETVAQWSKDHLICPFPSGKSTDAIHMSTNHVLFWMSNIAGAEELRDTDVDYGIVPFPKYDSEQENYYSLDWGGLMVVPTTIRNPEMVGATVELLAYGSDVEGGVIDTYYDLVLDGQLSQDPTAPQMLDILFDTICYDPGVTFWGLSGSYLQLFYYPWNYGVLQGRSDFSSFYASNKEGAQKFIDDYYEALAIYDSLDGWFG